MGQEVATKSRTELAQDSAYDPFAAAASDMGGGSAIYAKFNGNSGEFTYGAQAEEVEVGELMAANVAGARRGWICWKDSEVVEEVMTPIAEGSPLRKDQLTDHGPYTKHEDGTEDGWSEQFSIEFRLLGESHDGVEITYKTSTKSAMRPLGDLIKQYSREYKNNPGKVPIVEFSKGDYMPKEKKHGKKYFPKFRITDWIDEDELIATYGEGNKVEEGDENDNLIADKAAEEKAAKAEAAKKAKAAAEKKAKAEAAKAKAAEEAEETEDDAVDETDEIAALKAKLAAAEAAAAKKSVEETDEDNSDEETSSDDDDKPAPAGGRRSRRRSF